VILRQPQGPLNHEASETQLVARLHLSALLATLATRAWAHGPRGTWEAKRNEFWEYWRAVIVTYEYVCVHRRKETHSGRKVRGFCFGRS